jgi:hypothetical protein
VAKDNEIQADAEHGLDEREGEAERVEEQQQLEAQASERRTRERSRASARKSIPEGAEAAEATRGGETAYPYQRLIDDADDFFGHPAYVVAGALHGVDREFLTLGEVEGFIDDFLNHEVNPAPAEQG